MRWTPIRPCNRRGKDGINRKDALLHAITVLTSFEPKHEHKIAAVAYLMFLWFKKVPK
jgi:hypothetical protein